MKILNIRQAEIAKRFYVISEIEIVKSLNKLGQPSILLGMGHSNGNKKSDLLEIKAPLKRAALFQLKLLFLLPYLILKERFDVLIFDFNSVRSSFIVIILKYLGICKIFLDIRTIPVESDLNWRFTHAVKFAKIFFNGASFITEGTRKYIEDHLNIKFKNYVIWSSAVNLENFVLKNNFQHDSKISERIKNKFILFYHGSISPNRGVNLILDALNEVKAQIPNVLLISLSDNNQFIKDYCKQKGYGLEENILLIDSVENKLVPYYIALADFCVVPLPRIIWWEVSSPLKLMEYLAMEKPIILTDIKAHLDVVPNDSKFAVYFNPDINDDLENKIVEAYKNKSEYQKYGSAGRELVASQYTWDHQAEKLVNFFKQI